MCNSIKREGKRINYGENIPSLGKWSGFARTDGASSGEKTMADQWSADEWEIALLPVESFTERDKAGTEFSILANRIAVITSKDRKEVRILTRPSRNQFEKEIRDRMPVYMSDKWTTEKFIKFINEKLETNYKAA